MCPGKRYYTTTPVYPSLLFEYANKDVYRKKTPTKNYTLPYDFAVS